MNPHVPLQIVFLRKALLTFRALMRFNTGMAVQMCDQFLLGHKSASALLTFETLLPCMSPHVDDQLAWTSTVNSARVAFVSLGGGLRLFGVPVRCVASIWRELHSLFIGIHMCVVSRTYVQACYSLLKILRRNLLHVSCVVRYQPKRIAGILVVEADVTQHLDSFRRE